MEKPASPIIETDMFRYHFTPKEKTLVREVSELFPHMAEILVKEIIHHKSASADKLAP